MCSSDLSAVCLKEFLAKHTEKHAAKLSEAKDKGVDAKEHVVATRSVLLHHELAQYSANALGMVAGKACYATLATIVEVLKGAIAAQGQVVGADVALDFGLACIWTWAALKATAALKSATGGELIHE